MSIVDFIKIYCIFSIKPLWNRLKLKPVQSLVVLILIMGTLLCPFILFKGLKLSYHVPIKYFYLIFSAYFLYAFLEWIWGGNEFKKIDEKIIALIQLSPNRFKFFIKYIVFDMVIKSCLSYLLLLIVFLVYSEKSLVSSLESIALFGILIANINLLGYMISIVNLKLNCFVTRLIQSGLSVYFAVEIYSVFNMSNFEGSILSVAPQKILGNVCAYIFNDKSDFSNSEQRIVILSLFAFGIMTLALYSIMANVIKINPSDVIEIHTKQNTGKNGVNFRRLKNGLSFLPDQYGVLIAKELVQIWSEKSALIGASLHSLAAMLIMVLAAKYIEKKSLYIGIYTVVCYGSFLLSVFSLPRELRTLWIINTTNVSVKTVIWAKTIACFIAAALLGLVMANMYALFAVFLLDIEFVALIKPFLLSLLTAVPMSIWFGMIIGSLIPVEIVEKKKKISYKLANLEGFFLVLLVLLVTVPAYIMSGYGVDNKLTFYILLGAGLFYMWLLNELSTKLMSKKLKNALK